MSEWIIAFTKPENGEKIRVKYRGSDSYVSGRVDAEAVFEEFKGESWVISIDRKSVNESLDSKDAKIEEMRGQIETIHSDDILKWKRLN